LSRTSVEQDVWSQSQDNDQDLRITLKPRTHVNQDQDRYQNTDCNIDQYMDTKTINYQSRYFDGNQNTLIINQDNLIFK